MVPGYVAIGAVFFLSSAAMAQQVNLEGYFIALSACEANKRKDSDNPGNVRLEVMRAYKMIGRNATPGTTTSFECRAPRKRKRDGWR